MEDELSRLPRNGNQNTTNKSNYTMKTVSEINKIDKLSQGTFHITFKTIDQNQNKHPGLMYKLKWATYKSDFF